MARDDAEVAAQRWDTVQEGLAQSGLGRRQLLLGVGAVAAMTLLPSVARAANVRGKVAGYQLLVNPVWAQARKPDEHGYSFREAVPTVRAEFRNLFPHIPKELCIAAIAANPQAAHPVLVRLGGGRTTPVTLVVPPKTELQIKNTDPFTHRLYAVGDKAFTAADTVKGGIRKWSVPDARVYEIRDESAPSLRSWVVGEPNVAAIAYPSMAGDFILALAEPGAYKLQAYFCGKKVGPELPIDVAARDLALPQPIVVATKESVKAEAGQEKD
jgi:hypothetical protein